MKTTKSSVFGILIITLALAMQVQAQPSFVTNGLVAYYPFNGNANDASGNGNNGTVIGATLTQDMFGISNSAYFFDGVSNYIAVPDFPSADANAHTISLWIEANSWTNIPTPASYVDILSKDNFAAGQRQWTCQGMQTGQIRLTVFTSMGENILDSIAQVRTNQWHQVVTTWNGTNESVFINGVFDSSTSAAGPLVQTNAPVRIGGNPVDNQQFFDGKIDDVRIYNRALSSNEVQQLYQFESLAPCAPIVALAAGFTNGGFEVPQLASGTSQLLSQGSTALVGWTIGGTGGPVALMDNPANGPKPYQGNQEIRFNAGNTAPGSSISQSFQTLVGQSYDVSFAVAENGSGNVSVTASASASDGTILATNKCFPPASGWALSNLTFVATSTNTTLTFLDTSAQTIAVDMCLDDVNITTETTPVSPCPATATATVVDGFVVAATITYGGCGYTNTPVVLIQGGSGHGATATAVVSNGVVVDINITDAGIDYTNPPTILFGFPPSIIAEPQSVTVNANDTASFSVTASGTTLLNYQWSFNGTIISGATASTLTISNVVPTNLGVYAVVVTNPFGTINSSNAVLSMYPFLTSPFGGLDTDWGYTNTLSVGAWGSGPLSYQWFDNGIAIPNATNQTLTFTGIQLTNAGLYTVVVSNPFGSVTNTPEHVVVNLAGVSLGIYPGITINGVVGYNYIIQRTADLSDTNSWVTVTNLTLTEPVQLWVDTNINASLPANPQQFYQVLPGQ